MRRSARRNLQFLYTPKLTFMNYTNNKHIQTFKHVAACIWPSCHLIPKLSIRGDALLPSLLAFMAWAGKTVPFIRVLTSVLISHSLI